MSDEEVHREMMKTVLNEFTKQGFTNLQANFEGMTMPEKIGNYIPDLTCNRRDKHHEFVILEVETCCTLTRGQSEEKWRLFHEKARRMTGEFHLAVPKFCNGDSGRTLANQRVEQAGISADCVWAVNGSLKHISQLDKTRKSNR